MSLRLQRLERALADPPGATLTYPFGPDAKVYKVSGKMYALVAEKDGVPRVTLKLPPPEGEALREAYASAQPGYHMNKKHWVTIDLVGEIPDDELDALTRDSYDLVFKGLTKAARAAVTESAAADSSGGDA